MSSFTEMFHTTPAGGKTPKVFLAGFGKYPALSEYVQDLGKFSDKLLELRGKLDKPLKKIPEQDIIKLDHWLVLILPTGIVLGRIIPSHDLSGRQESFTVLAELHGCPLDAALRKIGPELDKFIHRVVKLPSPDVVRAAFASQQGTLESMIASDTAATQNLALTLEERVLFVDQGGFDADGLALSCLLYKTESSWAVFAPRGGKPPKTTDAGTVLRLPSLAAQVPVSILLWEELVTAQIHPDVSRLYVAPSNEDWLDLAVGEIRDMVFDNLLKNRSVLAPETTVNHPVTPDLQAKARDILLAWRYGNRASLTSAAKLEPATKMSGGTIFITKPKPAEPAVPDKPTTVIVATPPTASTPPVPPTPPRAPVASPAAARHRSRGNRGLLTGVGVAIFLVLAALVGMLTLGSKNPGMAQTNNLSTNKKTLLASNSATAPVPVPVKPQLAPVKARPATALVDGDATIYHGDSTTLHVKLGGEGPWTVTWSDGLTTNYTTNLATRLVHPEDNTNYTITDLADANNARANPNDLTGSAKIIVYAKLDVRVKGGTVSEGESLKLSTTVSGGAPPLTYSWSPRTYLDHPENPTPVARPDEDTTNSYTLTVKDSRGLTVTSSGPAIVIGKLHAPPTAVVSGGGQICPGDQALVQVALTGKKPWTLAWISGETAIVSNTPYIFSVSPQVSKTFQLQTLTDAKGTLAAKDGITGVAVFTVYQRPTANVSGGATVNKGDSATIQANLNGEGPWTVTWSDGMQQNATSAAWTRSVAPASNTIYSITGLADSHCTALSGDLTGTARFTVNDISAELERKTKQLGVLDLQLRKWLAFVNVSAGEIKTEDIRKLNTAQKKFDGQMIPDSIKSQLGMLRKEYEQLNMFVDSRKADLQTVLKKIDEWNNNGG